MQQASSVKAAGSPKTSVGRPVRDHRATAYQLTVDPIDLLRMSGFVVLAVSEQEGELEQAIETTADLVGCPSCGAVAQLHDRRPSWVRDLPTGGRPVTVVWVKRVWRCRHAWWNRMGRTARCLLRSGSFSVRPSAEPRGHLSMYEALQ